MQFVVGGLITTQYSNEQLLIEEKWTQNMLVRVIHAASRQKTCFGLLACVVAICCLVDMDVLLYLVCALLLCAGPMTSRSAVLAVRGYHFCEWLL